MASCCYQMYKELKLKANHNLLLMQLHLGYVVIKCTKSWSWKQITTIFRYDKFLSKLLSNVQRAEVESKSQQSVQPLVEDDSCYQMYKELKLKANHNMRRRLISLRWVVIKCTKSWSWKQITTMLTISIYRTTLLSNVQRAEVESKSQLVLISGHFGLSCYQMYKELKLKANHNRTSMLLGEKRVVIKCTKSWSWKQITTEPHGSLFFYGLLSNVQRAEVESKSQPGLAADPAAARCYQMYKELKLKANHNPKASANFWLMLLSNVQRAEVESKSQLA